MSMAAAFANALAACYRTFGEAATYDSAAVTVVITHDLTQWGEQISVATGRVGLSVRKSEVADRPARGDVFVVGSTSYRVESSISETEFEWTVLVKADGA